MVMPQLPDEPAGWGLAVNT